MHVLSFDISTTTIGIAVLYMDDGYNISLVHQEYFKPAKEGTIFERLDSVKKYIKHLINIFKPDDIAIEDLILFMKGKSTAQTITSLAIINRTIGLTCYEVLGKNPHLLSVMKIRHKLKFDKKLPQKEDMPEVVAKHLNIDFPYYKKINKKTKKEQIMTEGYDVADAIAVGLAYLKILSSGPNKKSPKPRKGSKSS